MAPRMQDKIMAEIEKKVAELGFSFVSERHFANIGIVRIMDDSEVIITFSYDFQGAYSSLQFYPPGVQTKRPTGFADKTCIKHFRFDYARIDLIIQIDQVLRLIGDFVKDYSKEKLKIN